VSSAEHSDIVPWAAVDLLTPRDRPKRRRGVPVRRGLVEVDAAQRRLPVPEEPDVHAFAAHGFRRNLRELAGEALYIPLEQFLGRTEGTGNPLGLLSNA